MDGTATPVAAERLTIDPSRTWTSPASGATYPVAWRIQSRDRRLDLRVTALLDDQELDTRQTVGLTYWEGAVRIEGARAGAAIAERGYVELTGYAKGRDGAVP